jgi:hypothetical protein
MIDLHESAGLRSLDEMHRLTSVGILEVPGLHLAILVHDHIRHIPFQHVIPRGAISAQGTIVLPVAELAVTAVSLQVGRGHALLPRLLQRGLIGYGGFERR